jgi:tetratricopeptide (TPR) repeat protein/tRNA A-37 threonylcarbamoyl transferase component Bud32
MSKPTGNEANKKQSADPDAETMALPDQAGAVFARGDVLAGRFRITRFIARGGMGEVFEAEDVELRERVAVKTIRPEIAADEAAMERFRREVLAARKITHPNVSRVFDLFHHDRPEGGRVPFVTMELLVGESLAERIRRCGRLREDDAWPLVRQMAIALSAAHDAGIVHRDFKPDNVMLVDSNEGTRAVVTDFGLARASEGGASDNVTGSGTLIGTPAYMAPEQVEGKTATPASDVYALGVVLFEMVTGARPFPADTPLAAAVKRLQEAPPSPRVHVPTLDERWEKVILKCLEREPARRIARADEVPTHLATRQVPRFPSRGGLAAAAALVFGVALTLVFLRANSRDEDLQEPSGPVDTSSVQVRPSVAVLGFRNLSGRPEAAWLSTALSEMLSTDLAAGEALRVLSGESVSRLKNDLALASEDGYARDTLERIRAHASVDFVLLGSYLALEKPEGELRLNVRLQDTRAGETIATVSESGSEAGLVDLISAAGTALREKVSLLPRSGAGESVLRASLPSRPEVIKLYSEGLAKLRVFDYRGAKEELEAAARLEPGHPSIRWALAQSWSSLGYTGRAQEEAKAAFESSSQLPLEERLKIEALYRSLSESKEDRDRAAELYKTLFDSFPDELEYGLGLARLQNPPAESLKTTDELKKLAGGLGEDPRIYLWESEFAQRAADLERALAAAERAAALAEPRGARLVLAEALLREGDVSLLMGERERGAARLERAKTLYLAAGDPIGASRALLSLAWPAFLRDRVRAKEILAEAVALSREAGALPQMASALERFAEVLAGEGQYDASFTMMNEAVDNWTEVGDQIDAARALNWLGWLHSQQGDLVRAEELERQSLARIEAVGAGDYKRYSLMELAGYRFERGYLRDAQRLDEQTLAINREIGDTRKVAFDLVTIAAVFEEQGRYEEAEQAYAEATRIFEASSDREQLAIVHWSWSELLLADSRWVESKTHLETTRRLWAELGRPLNEAAATGTLSLLHFRLGDAPAAAADRERTLQALSHSSRESGDTWDLDRLGSSLVRMGELDAARRSFEMSLESAERGENSLDANLQIQRIGWVLYWQGRLNESAGFVEKAVAGLQRSKSMGNVLDAQFQLARLEAEKGNLEAARKIHDEIAAAAKRLGLERRAAYAELDGLDVSLEAGHSAGSASRAAAILEQFREEEAVYGQSYALYVLARLARHAGDRERALEWSERAKTLARRIVIRRYWNSWHLGFDLPLLVRIENARDQALSGDRGQAVAELDSIYAEAMRLKSVPLQLRVRLARAEIDSRAPDGRAALERLEREAREKGFHLIAREAREAM